MNFLYVGKSFKIIDKHYVYWNKMFPEKRFEVFMSMHAPSMQQFAIGFQQEEHRTEFEAWRDGYMAKFQQGTEMTYDFPPPLDGAYPHTVLISHPEPLIGITAEWLWILKNCVGEVRFLPHVWFFEKEDDWMIFKLQFNL